MNTCPKCQSTNLIYVEYTYNVPEYYDGASEINCLDCNYREGRWSGKELAEGELEPKYGIAK